MPSSSSTVAKNSCRFRTRQNDRFQALVSAKKSPFFPFFGLFSTPQLVCQTPFALHHKLKPPSKRKRKQRPSAQSTKPKTPSASTTDHLHHNPNKGDTPNSFPLLPLSLPPFPFCHSPISSSPILHHSYHSFNSTKPNPSLHPFPPSFPLVTTRLSTNNVPSKWGRPATLHPDPSRSRNA